MTYELDQGLKALELTSVTLEKSMVLNQCYSKPSRNDCLALAAAIQETCTLLTGDKALRKAAIKEKIEVKGTLWLMEELINNQLISRQEAINAFDDMKRQEAGCHGVKLISC